MKGKVYLVGAGPGDYGLLTLKGLTCIQKAEVIVYDRLASSAYLKEASATCECIYVGKEASHHTLTQDEINTVLVTKAKEGKVVIRLKGGDPYVFGRGGEEGERLYAEGIDFEVVPGVTSAIGGLCYAGIPITHRDYSSSFHVVTGHLKSKEETINWQALAQVGGTLVFLMGVSNLETICSNLVVKGMEKGTPVAVIQWATRVNQKVVVGDLETIVERVSAAGITSPSLIVVGKVVTLREQLGFFERKPLFGKTVVTTRARRQESQLTKQLEDLGARVVEFPSIRIQPVIEKDKWEGYLEKLDTYDYILFSSQHGVEYFFEKLLASGKDSRMLAGVKVVAVGKVTQKSLLQYGIVADRMPERFVADAVCDLLLPELLGKEARILLPTAAHTSGVLEERLGRVATVDRWVLYETVLEEEPKGELSQLLKEGGIDYITFTSSSTARNFKKLMGEEMLPVVNHYKLIAIGEVTARTMEQEGLQVYGKPDEFTIEAMVEWIVKDVRTKENR